MKIYKNLILIYGILPYITNIENKWEFMISIFLGIKNCKLKINDYIFKFSPNEYNRLFYFLQLLEFSFSYKILRTGQAISKLRRTE